jgi:ABC-type spermidine/putrescine transport system permease subunit II
MVRQSFQSSQLHLNWKLLKWYENQFENLKASSTTTVDINSIDATIGLASGCTSYTKLNGP